MRNFEEPPSSEEPQDPLALFKARDLGAMRVLARHVAPLRTDVTNAVCEQLPGASGTGVSSWLAVAMSQHLSTAPDALADLEPRLAPDHLASVLLPGLMLYPVWYELRLPARLESAPEGDPRPTGALRAFHGEAQREVDRLVGGFLRIGTIEEMRRQQADVLRELGAEADEWASPAWGGWALLGFIDAVRTHPTLPRPGRARWRLPWNRARGRAAGVALQLGEALLLSTALALLEADGLTSRP
ncbi:hypothetical protein [Streptomyces atriruber]|uniref:hypothetical protein n=1 Tax=Streptomyces atriruber TaxID=545121 RepID=UPI0006E3FDBE|nr:hypothetical protein [Streptomyces atriruber]